MGLLPDKGVLIMRVSDNGALFSVTNKLVPLAVTVDGIAKVIVVPEVGGVSKSEVMLDADYGTNAINLIRFTLASGIDATTAATRLMNGFPDTLWKLPNTAGENYGASGITDVYLVGVTAGTGDNDTYAGGYGTITGGEVDVSDVVSNMVRFVFAEAIDEVRITASPVFGTNSVYCRVQVLGLKNA